MKMKFISGRKGQILPETRARNLSIPEYPMKNLLGDFKIKERREDIFKPTTEYEILHKIENDDGVTVVNFAISKTNCQKSNVHTSQHS
jgi:hypothetical protein